MNDDEQAIQRLVKEWITASEAGDLDRVLKLMSNDVVFMVPGQEPFGKDTFASNFRQMQSLRFEATSEIKECKILGEWAWTRNLLNVTIIPQAGERMLRSGYTLTILHKEPDGRWVIHRDANLLWPDEEE